MSDIDIGQISEALNDKMDRDGRNADTVSGGDVVIEFQEPTAANNYTWYRKYKSGWVEQGSMTGIGGGDKAITFPVIMADTDYMFFASAKESDASSAVICAFPLINTRTTTGMTIRRTYNGGTAGENFCWEIKGIAAS